MHMESVMMFLQTTINYSGICFLKLAVVRLKIPIVISRAMLTYMCLLHAPL